MSVSIAELVAEGRDRSATFRSLPEGLGVSGWIVFVQEGACRVSVGVYFTELACSMADPTYVSC